MKHKLGNTTHCIDCYHFREKDELHKTHYDGFCKLGCIINGKKVSDREPPVYWNDGSGCRDWEDAEARLTHFEVMTRQPDPKRTPLEAEHIRKLLGGQ